jgi:hypothetical protein
MTSLLTAPILFSLKRSLLTTLYTVLFNLPSIRASLYTVILIMPSLLGSASLYCTLYTLYDLPPDCPLCWTFQNALISGCPVDCTLHYVLTPCWPLCCSLQYALTAGCPLYCTLQYALPSGCPLYCTVLFSMPSLCAVLIWVCTTSFSIIITFLIVLFITGLTHNCRN